MKNLLFSVSFFLLGSQIVLADGNPLAFGAAAGVEFPFEHSAEFDPGIVAEAFWRKDPFELRFHFADTKTQVYAVLVGIKYFFSNGVMRPYAEAAAGPVVVNPQNKKLAYGARPEATLGVDLGLSRNASVGLATRYFAQVYFGSTNSGKWEANHGLSLALNGTLWF